ncbi:MAG TPA: hypothetical protein VLG37_05385 [Candidatus Saccharimonadales bacterium]|nr:hypothetical protein [Candidatus Saccharimonadales bacterium]
MKPIYKTYCDLGGDFERLVGVELGGRDDAIIVACQLGKYALEQTEELGKSGSILSMDLDGIRLILGLQGVLLEEIAKGKRDKASELDVSPREDDVSWWRPNLLASAIEPIVGPVELRATA